MSHATDEDPFGDISMLENFNPDVAIIKSRLNSTTKGVKRTNLIQNSPDSLENSTVWKPDDSLNPASSLQDFMSPAAGTAKRRRVTPESYFNQEANIPTDSYTSQQDELPMKTLEHYFGYTQFRGEQLKVIQSILDGRDCSVFWPTGFGKSLCYTIPPLHTQKVALVVSPLISLMQDQVHKLNSLVENTQLATFLGSAQNDPQAEQEALMGRYPLVYVTPEKLEMPGFRAQLEQMLARKLSVIAIDEAHCVSEWGHDFRPSYRTVGHLLRSDPDSALSQVPIVALTATATPRVQDDIAKSLKLAPNHFRATRSLDRTNLKLTVQQKIAGGVASNLVPLVQSWKKENSKMSTIIYAPTRSVVEEIAQTLTSNGLSTSAYHAGMSPETRDKVHTDFLTGQISMLVATVAFGMGIDKPDIRRVVHYGPPKTMEEYYQQIGRAGRDGLPAECLLLFSASDLDRYQSDFYLGQLTPTAKEWTLHSMKRMKHFCFDAETCRRQSLLSYFEEKLPQPCGTCDVCLAREAYGDDTQRDFGKLGARVVLASVAAMNDQGLTQILNVAACKKVDAFRYRRGLSPDKVNARIQELRAEVPKKFPSAYYKDLASQLLQKKYLVESSKTAAVGGYKRTWTTFGLSHQGKLALSDPTMPIHLAVPDSIRKVEKQEEERRQRVLSDLTKRGLDTAKLPAAEVEQGDGNVIRAYSKWYTYLENASASGNQIRAQALKKLLASLENWRTETAIQNQMAPASVLSEHLMVSIAYTIATGNGMQVDKASLVAAGVRARNMDNLVTVLNLWVDHQQQRRPSSPTGRVPNSPSRRGVSEAAMILKETGSHEPWVHAVYKPNKKTGVATWEASYLKFAKGESPQTIAMTAGVQVKTVVGHILDAVVHGRTVDLRRLVESGAGVPPTKQQWEQLQAAELSSGMAVDGDPSSSGRHGGKFTLSDFLRPIISDRVVEKPFAERTPAEKREFGIWCERLKWFIVLRRIGYEPEFENNESR